MEIKNIPLKKLSQSRLDLLVLPLSQKKPFGLQLPPKDPLQKAIAQHIQHEDLLSKPGSRLMFYPNSAITNRVLLLELGKGDEMAKNLRTQIENFKHIVSFKRCGIVIPSRASEALVTEFVFGCILASFQYHQKSKTPENSPKLEQLIFFCDKKNTKSIAETTLIADAINRARTLAETPANHLTPTKLAEYAKGQAVKYNLKIQVMSTELQTKGFGGVCGISRGSTEPPQVITLEYNPQAKKTIALVGKGITFDSGGLSIKPSKDMHEMKYDMIGGAYVLTLLEIAAGLQLPYHFVGIILAAENLPGGKALKPGDVITQYGGVTVEVLNTDAEGRLLLADGLAFAQKRFKPALTLDFATLTGAVIVALGNKITGCFGTHPAVNQQVLTASERTGESFHFLPLFSGYRDELRSSVADIANIGKQRFDALIAALFLQKFINPTKPWVHFDIAGTAWNNEGPTGTGIRTVVEFFKKLKASSL